jgi:hypothetical protein
MIFELSDDDIRRFAAALNRFRLGKRIGEDVSLDAKRLESIGNAAYEYVRRTSTTDPDLKNLPTGAHFVMADGIVIGAAAMLYAKTSDE